MYRTSINKQIGYQIGYNITENIRLDAIYKLVPAASDNTDRVHVP